MSDRPVGIFLSGGIDSSTNAALFADGERQRVKTFSIAYDADYASYRSELPYARFMAERIGADHHERVVALDDLLAFLPEMVRLQDEPIADPVSVPLYYVSELARENDVVVCQAGEGADELFFGYPAWRTHLRLQRADDLPVPASRSARASQHSPPSAGTARGRTSSCVAAPKACRCSGAARRRSPRRRSGGSSWPELRRESASCRRGTPSSRSGAAFEETAWETSHVNWMTYLDLRSAAAGAVARRGSTGWRWASASRCACRSSTTASSSSRCRYPRRRRRGAAS